MSTVFVVQEPKTGTKGFIYDLTPALDFGQIVFVFKAGEQPGLKPGPSTFHARRVLQGFCDQDYILWAGGDPAGLSIVSMVAADMNFDRLKMLRWERHREKDGRGFYMPIEIGLRQGATCP